jgi:aerobic carbon-monoxide dehydrogenase medium subunit
LKPRAFAYHRPASLDEALALLAGGDEVAVLAGGQSLVPMMSFRLAAPAHLVDINGIDGLGGIREEGGRLQIGALVRHQEIADHPLIQARLPLLARIARSIAHWPIRTRGTIGGSLAQADPAGQWPFAAVLLGAEIVLRSVRGERMVAAGDFFEGALATARAEDELVTGLALDLPPAGHRSAFHLLARRPGDYAVAMVGAIASDTALRLAIGGVEPRPRDRSPAAPLAPGTAIGALVEAACADLEPMDDPRSPADYRSRVLPGLVAACLREVLPGGTA